MTMTTTYTQRLAIPAAATNYNYGHDVDPDFYHSDEVEFLFKLDDDERYRLERCAVNAWAILNVRASSLDDLDARVRTQRDRLSSGLHISFPAPTVTAHTIEELPYR